MLKCGKPILLVFFLLAVHGYLLGAEYITDQVENAREPSLWDPGYYSIYTHNTFHNFVPFQTRIDVSNIDYPLLHAALFFETNRVRVLHGQTVLEWNLNLEITAYNHSVFMVDKFEFAHYSGDARRRSPNDRARLGGITNPGVNENISINFALDYIEETEFYVHGDGVFSYTNNPADALPVLSYMEFAVRAVELWMKSPAHRRNMLSPHAVQLGTGAFFFREANSGYFPKFRTTQNFQWFNPVVAGEVSDPLPPGYIIENLE